MTTAESSSFTTLKIGTQGLRVSLVSITRGLYTVERHKSTVPFRGEDHGLAGIQYRGGMSGYTRRKCLSDRFTEMPQQELGKEEFYLCARIPDSAVVIE